MWLFLCFHVDVRQLSRLLHNHISVLHLWWKSFSVCHRRVDEFCILLFSSLSAVSSRCVYCLSDINFTPHTTRNEQQQLHHSPPFIQHVPQTHKHTHIYDMLACSIKSYPKTAHGSLLWSGRGHTQNDAEQQKTITSVAFVSFFTARCLLAMLTSEICGLTNLWWSKLTVRFPFRMNRIRTCLCSPEGTGQCRTHVEQAEGRTDRGAVWTVSHSILVTHKSTGEMVCHAQRGSCSLEAWVPYKDEAQLQSVVISLLSNHSASDLYWISNM